MPNGALIWIASLSLLMFVGSIVLIWFLIVRMPVDYLIRERTHERVYRHPVMHLAWVIARNLLGVLLVTAGIVMLLTPGQGVLSVLIGLTLIDFPGKRRVILRTLAGRRVLATINAIRRRAHKPPLET